jgi:hypothetical protein
MCTYCNTKNYRKIYENHIGLISKDSDGRTYEIHHIDGNHSNNDPSNLKAVTIQEHYDIHYAQGDWYACWKIGVRMKLSPEEISKLTSELAKERVENGTHHFIGDKNPVHALVKNGTHNFLGGEFQRKKVEDGTHHLLGPDANKKRIENGTHHFLGENNPSRKKVEAGTHHFLNSEFQKIRANERVKNGTHPWLGGEIARKNAIKQVEAGTHPFMGATGPSKIRSSCMWCRRESNISGISRHKCTKFK